MDFLTAAVGAQKDIEFNYTLNLLALGVGGISGQRAGKQWAKLQYATRAAIGGIGSIANGPEAGEKGNGAGLGLNRCWSYGGSCGRSYGRSCGSWRGGRRRHDWRRPSGGDSGRSGRRL